jgi:hypothetical protein
MRIAEVAGAPFSVARLAAAIAAREPAGIALGVESDKQMPALAVTYDGGMRYPKLERIPEQPERLKSLLRPR